jgi:hypothetical protein
MSRFSKILSSVLFTSVALSSVAYADTATDLQNQLRSVLQRIEELRTQLVQIDNPTAVPGGGSCPTLTRTLRRGSTGADVSGLQAFLMKDPSIYTSGVVGIFGAATEAGVKRFQTKYGIASYGTPDTTGYGLVGAKTRAVIASLCGGGSSDVGDTSLVADFSFSPSSGTAPVPVRLSLKTLQSQCLSYEIDWGDGTEKTTYDALSSVNNVLGCGTGITERILTHTYNQSGLYTAVVRGLKGTRSGSMPELARRQITINKGDPFVRVDQPNESSMLRLGEYTKIKWTTGNYPDDSAIAFYMVGPSQTYSFAKRSMRTREFDWIVGDRVCDGNSCDVQMPVGQYRIRSVMYAPIDGCLDFCGTDDSPARIITTSETGTFTVGNIGTSGNAPITVAHSRGNAPLTTNIHVEIQPTSAVSNFEVDFGDGTNKFTIAVPPGETRATTRDIAHTYTKEGTFTIAIRPVGGIQNVGTATIIIDSPKLVVSPKEGSLAPTVARATFPADQSCTTTPNIVRRYTIDWGDATETSEYQFTPPLCANSSNPGPQNIVSQTLTHAYDNSGTFTVKLRAVSGSYSYDSTQSISIAANDFKVTPSFGFVPLTATATYKTDQGCSLSGAGYSTVYTVDWGDGTPVSTQSVSAPACTGAYVQNLTDKTLTHQYTVEGNFTAKLSVKRSDVPTTWIKTRDVVVDHTAFDYMLRRFTMLGTDTAQNIAGVAQAFFSIINDQE